LAANVLRHRAAFCDHLIEAAIEPRQCFGDAIRGVRVCRTRGGGWRRRRAVHDRRDRRRRSSSRRGRSLRHALKLPRQTIETVMHRREAIFDVLVFGMVAI
jgi:hypothetical protein